MRTNLYFSRLLSQAAPSSRKNSNASTHSSIKWIPFRIDKRQALDRLNTFYRVNRPFGPTSSQLLPVGRVRKLLIPHYFYNIQVKTIIEAVIDKEIKVLALRHNYTPDNCKAMRVSGTHAFPASLLSQLRSTTAPELPFSLLTELPAGVANDQPGEELEMLPFSIPEHVAASNQLEPFLQTRESRRAELYLKHKYPRWRNPTRDIDFRIRLQFEQYDQHCVYLPCYAIESRYMPRVSLSHNSKNNNMADNGVGEDDDHQGGEVLITLVDGFAGKVSGIPYVFNPTRCGQLVAGFSASAALAASALFGTTGAALTAKSLALFGAQWFLFPFLLTAAAVQVMPTAQLMWMAARMRLAEGDITRSLTPYDPLAEKMTWDIKKIIGRYEDWQKQETERQRAQDYFNYQAFISDNPESTFSAGTQDSPGNGFQNHPDPRGYYAVLGVSAEATKEEIQAAFRKLAIIYHPDKQLNSAQAKQEAAGRFQRISQAYSVLRDDRLRYRYDLMVGSDGAQ